MRITDGITYSVLGEDKIRDYVVKICEAEWDAEDFPKYGDDLYKSQWKLEEVEVSKIKVDQDMLQSETFQKDVQPRIVKQRELHEKKEPIPPLILRGNDLLIFDGYARYHLLQELGIKKCLAYVGAH